MSIPGVCLGKQQFRIPMRNAPYSVTAPRNCVLKPSSTNEEERSFSQLTTAHIFAPSTTAIEAPGTCHSSNVSLANSENLVLNGLAPASFNTFCRVVDERGEKLKRRAVKLVSIFKAMPLSRSCK